MSDFQTGDIVCFGDRSWLSGAIRWFTRSKGEPPTKCSHVGVMYDSENICEALRTVQIQPVLPRLFGGWREVYRPAALTDGEKADIILQCEYYKGKSYGWWKNLAHALDGLLGGAYLFRRALFMDNYPICSWLVAWVYERCVLPSFFGKPPNAVQPDDIHDMCQNSWRFELIYSTERGASNGTSTERS